MPRLFPITVEVEEIKVGRVMRQLQKSPDIVTVTAGGSNPKAAKTNGAGEMPSPRAYTGKPRPSYAVKGADELLKFLSRAPRTTAELRADFQIAGRSPASVASLTHELKNTGRIKKAPDGEKWTLTKKERDRLRHHNRKKK